MVKHRNAILIWQVCNMDCAVTMRKAKISKEIMVTVINLFGAVNLTCMDNA